MGLSMWQMHRMAFSHPRPLQVHDRDRIGYPRRTFPGAGDDSPLVGGRFSAHFIHDTVDVFSDETRNARKLVNQSLGKCKSAFYISF